MCSSHFSASLMVTPTPSNLKLVTCSTLWLISAAGEADACGGGQVSFLWSSCCWCSCSWTPTKQQVRLVLTASNYLTDYMTLSIYIHLQQQSVSIIFWLMFDKIIACVSHYSCWRRLTFLFNVTELIFHLVMILKLCKCSQRGDLMVTRVLKQLAQHHRRPSPVNGCKISRPILIVQHIRLVMAWFCIPW